MKAMHSSELKDREKRLLRYMRSKQYIPLSMKELSIVLDVPPEDLPIFINLIEKMLNERTIESTRKGRLIAGKSEKMHGIIKTFAAGYAFLLAEEEDDDDLFIPATGLNGAINGDRVEARIIKKAHADERAVGEIVRILAQSTREIVGTFEKNKKSGIVVADDSNFGKDIYIPKEADKGAITGQKVVVKIVKRGRKNLEGKVIEILGAADEPGVDVLSAIISHELPYIFSKESKREAKLIPQSVAEGEYQNRADYTNLQTITIDGEDTKDFDDALTLRMDEDRFILGVHIADVSHYVREKSAIDKDAFKRGNSVYLLDRVIPMLPEELSNGICSLNEGQDRLTLSVMMTIDASGKLIAHEIKRSVIKVDKRLIYTKASLALAGDATAKEEYHDYLPMLSQLQKLALILSEKRKHRGSIDFEMPECKIILNEEGHVHDIALYERNIASKMIEEFMILANETVAEDFFWRDVPFIFRTHESPDPDNVKELSTFLRSFGYTLKGGVNSQIHSKAFGQVLKKAEGKDEENVLNRRMLRTMKQARYAVNNIGHFGLSSQYYCHFTSPIRRYADLQIHRMITGCLEGQLKPKKIATYEKRFLESAIRCSKTERIAEQLEREIEQTKKAEYMADKCGQEYEGVISFIAPHGIYVELPNTVEGLVSLSSLSDDYYIYDKENMRYIGDRSKKIYTLGQKVAIRVVKVLVSKRQIDFEIIQQNNEAM